MKFLKALPVYLLGLIFLFSSLQFFASLIWTMPMPEMTPLVAQFFTIFFATKYLLVVKILELIISVLILVPRTRKLGIILIAPIIINIFLFETLVSHTVMAGVPLIILDAIAIYQNRKVYMPIIAKSSGEYIGQPYL